MVTMGDVLLQYYITAFPTTFMIDREGRVIGYASGADKRHYEKYNYGRFQKAQNKGGTILWQY